MSSGGFPPGAGQGLNQGAYEPRPGSSFQSTATSSSQRSSTGYLADPSAGPSSQHPYSPHGSATYHSSPTAPRGMAVGPSEYPQATSTYGPQYQQNMSASAQASGAYAGSMSQVYPYQQGHNTSGYPDPGYIGTPPEWKTSAREQEPGDRSSYSEHPQAGKSKGHMGTQSQRRPSSRDDFDGPNQFLQRPSSETVAAQDRGLLQLPMNLHVEEQDGILSQVNDRLSQCAFDFVAKYQFPIPLDADKRPVRTPTDREWTEWCFLLKRLATKRRIPARLLYNGQIKQLITVLENSMEMRHAAAHQSRPPKDDRNVLQLISAGIQVAKLLRDAAALEFLDGLYVHTEALIKSRKPQPAPTGFCACVLCV